MATECEPITIAELKQGMRRKEISVRVLRKWIRKSHKKADEINYKAEIYGMEFILMDTEENVIQASAGPKLMDTHYQKLDEGETYKIAKFTTSLNRGSERATLHNCKIYIEWTTRVKKTTLQIPMNKFTFTSIADILHENVKNDHYIDVIGEFYEYRPITIKGDCRWTSIDIVYECNDKITCRIWGDYCDDITKIVTQSNQSNEKPIIVLQFVQRNYYNQIVTIATTRATRFFLNPEIPKAKEIRERRKGFANATGSSRIIESTSEDKDILKGATLKKLIDIKNTDMAGDFVTFLNILEIDLKVDWYYYSCNHCRSKATFVDDLWICEGKRTNCPGKEGMKDSIPRYQAKFVVADGDVEADIKVFDTVISEIFNISAADLLAKQERAGNKNKVPTQFKLFIDLDWIAKVRVSREFNIEKNSHCYTVLKMSDDEQLISRWKDAYSRMVKGKQVVAEDGSQISNEATSVSDLELQRNHVEGEDGRQSSHEVAIDADLELLISLKSSDPTDPKSTTSSNKTPQKRNHTDSISSVTEVDAEGELFETPIKDQASTNKLIRNIKKEKIK